MILFRSTKSKKHHWDASSAGRPPKVAFLAGTLGLGGAERQLYYFAKALTEAGIPLMVLSFSAGEFWEHKIRSLGVEVKWVGRFNLIPIRIVNIIAALLKFQPDIVQSVHFHLNLYSVICGKVLNAKVIGAIRNDVNDELVQTGRFGKPSLHLPKVMAVNSRHAIRSATDSGVSAHKLMFLPNAIDSSLFTSVTRTVKKPINMLTVGRLYPQKRIDRFLTVLSKVVARLPSSKSVIGSVVGDGPLRNDLSEQARRLNLFPRNLKFERGTENVIPLYHQADIFVLTSDFEGTPNVVLEAMACGLPVVAFNVPGVTEIIRHGETGFLVDPQSDTAMADLIIVLSLDGALRVRIGRRARDYVVKMHSFESLRQNLPSLYKEVLQQ